MPGSAPGSTPWTHASRGAAAAKAWATKRATGKLHGGGTTPYIPKGNRAKPQRVTQTSFQLGAVYDFGARGRFRKTAKGWSKVAG
jgi:hypothetical protein